MLGNKFADLHFNQIASSVLLHRKRTRKKGHFPPLESDRKSFCIHSKFYKTHVKKQVCWPPHQSDMQQSIVSPHKNEKKSKKFNSLHLNQIGTTFAFIRNFTKQMLGNKFADLHFNQIASNVLFYKRERKKIKSYCPPLESDRNNFCIHSKFYKIVLRNQFADLHFNQIASNVLFHHIKTRKNQEKLFPSTWIR